MGLTPEITKTFHVFLASPGDMERERQMVRKFFTAYNRDTVGHRGLRFEVVDWENYSTIGVGRPQELITRQTLLKYRKSLALVIGLLGQRFGTPTGEHDSGTKEEFETAMQLRTEQGDFPEIKLFFREQWGEGTLPTDSKSLEDVLDQKRKVEAFRDTLQQHDPPLFTASFDRTEDFPEVVFPDLTRWLNDLNRPWNGFAVTPPKTSEPQTRVQETPYLDIWLRLLAADCARLPLEVLDARQGLAQTAAPIRLPDVFVPLKAIEPPKAWIEGDGNQSALIRLPVEEKEREPQPVMDLIQKHRLAVIVGDPGSGKSALVNELTWQLLQAGTGKTLSPELRGRLPIRIILRQVDIPAREKQGQAGWLWNTLEADIRQKLEDNHKAGDQAATVLKVLRNRLVHEPGGVILLDGLDEVPDVGARRTRLLQAIQSLVDALPAHTRVIVTARPYAYADPRWRLADFTALILTPFDKDQRHQFIVGWYEAARTHFGLQERDLKQRLPDLLERVEAQRHLQDLARRPLLLTLIATLHASGGRLPEDRVQLYADSVGLLLYQWRSGRAFRNSDGEPLILEEHDLRPCLQRLAYEVHKLQRQQKGTEDTADISREQLLAAFEPLLARLGQDDLLAYLEQHAGILIAREQGRYAFPHRSFQEYLAMGWLTAQSEDALSQAVCEDPLWWREVFLLAIAEQRRKPRFAINQIEDTLAAGEDRPALIRYRLFFLAGLALLELGLTGWDTHDFTTTRERIRDGIVKLIQQETGTMSEEERAEAGRVLGRIGDPRPGVGLTADGLPAIDWVDIPAGHVMLEDKTGADNVERFRIARYPITHDQFEAFVSAADDYRNRDWWIEMPKNAKDGPQTPRWSEPNDPRETVSWHEAVAFCRWLSRRLGFEVRLPTEFEWQQAATGGDPGNVYPWGPAWDSRRCNSGESGLNRTTAVGLYPAGASPQGVLDLAGNVWEWCQSKYKKPNDPEALGVDDSGAMRVLRGGAWGVGPVGLRSADRFGDGPDGRYGLVGFRVVCRPPSSSEH